MTIPRLYNSQDLVEEFHTIYGQPIRTTFVPNPPEATLRLELIREEVEELGEAVDELDMVEIIDALGDIVYVVAGAAITYGVPITPTPIVPLTHATPVRVGEDNKDFLIGFTALIEGIYGWFRLYHDSVKPSAKDNITASLNQLVSSCFAFANSLGVDLSDIMDEIQLSNLSKLDSEGNVLRREDGKILKGENWFAPRIKEYLESKGWSE